MRKIRGPRPGETPGQKRKAEEELSTNPHTEKCRKRVEKMTEIEKKLERYKNNDRQARTVVLKKLRATPTYQQADESEKRTMEDQAKNDVMQQR